MSEKRVRFECPACGCNELAYQVYAKCITKVELKDDGNIEYGQSKFDPDDYLCTENTFLCANCESYVEHCSFRMETEKELLDYLNMDPEIRKKEQAEYEESLNAHAETEDEIEVEQETF